MDDVVREQQAILKLVTQRRDTVNLTEPYGSAVRKLLQGIVDDILARGPQPPSSKEQAKPKPLAWKGNDVTTSGDSLQSPASGGADLDEDEALKLTKGAGEVREPPGWVPGTGEV